MLQRLPPPPVLAEVTADATPAAAEVSGVDNETDLSAKMLTGFQEACKNYLPHMTEPDLKKKRIFFMEKKWLPKTKRREAA